MNTGTKAERAMIEERGTPRELAERMTHLPEGEYRVYVQRVQSRAEILADFDRETEEMERNPPPETVGMDDDEVMALADQVIQEVRRSSRRAS